MFMNKRMVITSHAQKTAWGAMNQWIHPMYGTSKVIICIYIKKCQNPLGRLGRLLSCESLSLILLLGSLHGSWCWICVVPAALCVGPLARSTSTSTRSPWSSIGSPIVKWARCFGSVWGYICRAFLWRDNALILTPLPTRLMWVPICLHVGTLSSLLV